MTLLGPTFAGAGACFISGGSQSLCIGSVPANSLAVSQSVGSRVYAPNQFLLSLQVVKPSIPLYDFIDTH